MCAFEDALSCCCECNDDGTAALKQPFLYPLLDARAADHRRSMVGKVDLQIEESNDGLKVTQVTYPLDYEPFRGTYIPPNIKMAP